MEVGTENHALLGRNRPGAGKTLRANPGNVVGRTFTEGAGNPKGSCQRPGQPSDPTAGDDPPLSRKSIAVAYLARRGNHRLGKEPILLMGEVCPETSGLVPTQQVLQRTNPKNLVTQTKPSPWQGVGRERVGKAYV